jgi:hypothetical protein
MIPPTFLPPLLLPFLNCTAARNPGDENPMHIPFNQEIEEKQEQKIRENRTQNSSYLGVKLSVFSATPNSDKTEIKTTESRSSRCHYKFNKLLLNRKQTRIMKDNNKRDAFCKLKITNKPRPPDTRDPAYG